ncbi:hypothetical protein DES53_109275 [Roseimicrobium gellanilyticum]|uniref:Uncharacterized protein n=1 Tax=Roseimicrobium gellanilyticum TaxID=748857 RepID=A0A366HC39_9BACT|nr:hypothetical protein [Roseimicrobium gellanilyticum]RBP39847.1 hypothetical protein DES53_109275 [Roseimicrobium gellanilyticum]
MYPSTEVLKYLLERDGSTRDITFRPAARWRLIAFCEQLLSKYSIESLSDSEGEDQAEALKVHDWETLFGSSCGHSFGVFRSDSAIIQRLLCFVDWDLSDHSEYEVELSFFPTDLCPTTFTLPAFRELVEEWRTVLGADDYFVRQENASWDLYDSTGLGVIYTHLRPPLH